MRLRVLTGVTASILCAATVGFAAPAMAQDAPDDGVAYAGATVGDGYNAYAGAVVALPGASLGNGLAVRGSVSLGEYRYDSGGTRIKADYKSAELALVYQTSGSWGWANFSAGPRLTDTKTDPSDPGNRREGTRVDGALTTDGALGNNWRLGWFGSYGAGDEAYYTQLRFGPLLDAPSQTRIGVEGSLQGDETYDRHAVGLFASTAIARNMELRLSGGVGKTDGRDRDGYAAIAISRLF
ncbi:cellulose biosynthesis protein BcsS [Croceicoccus bisphenolivorans]|uniref:cellulose biosynthesis protein BcsS n=1 Tax=Croceicoccus bisphenolivorans TaxID=1783232 RepID=UPI000830B59A|nr:cellulose biosynthesis protein BcsS [Croceicoccus bisphenolivorans]